jgi:hypothetical protein
MELVRSVWTFAVPVMFMELEKILVVVRLFEMYAFPWTMRGVSTLGAVPMPMGELVTRVCTFAVPKIVMEDAEINVVVIELDTYIVPWTMRGVSTLGFVPIPMGELVTRVCTFAIPETFARITEIFVVEIEFEA